MSRDRRLRRTLLFFPASRPDRFAKAMASGADSVCIDLEDAVAPSDKDAARAAALGLLAAEPPGDARVVLRINSPRTPAGVRDLAGLLDAPPLAVDLLLPKVESPEEVRWVEEVLAPSHPDLRLLPMIETARGVAAADAIAHASPRVDLLMLGGVDLAAQTGATMSWEALLHARSRVVYAAASAEVEALDTVFIDVGDAGALAREAAGAAALGFTGKAAIHPSQIEPIHRAFSPDAEEVARARALVAAYEAAGGGVLLLDGKLVERPVVRRAERVLAIAAAEAGARG